MQSTLENLEAEIMTRIMEALFDGRYIPWERRGHMTEERREVEGKIQYR